VIELDAEKCFDFSVYCRSYVSYWFPSS